MSSNDQSDSGNKYSQVPPPSEFTSSTTSVAPVDFSDALQKARAIAEKLKQSTGGGAPSDTSSSGIKRSHYDDHDQSDTKSSSQQYSYESSKRTAYDTGSSQPSYMSRSEPRRYGLGSEERSRYHRHETSSSSSNNIKVPNRLVGVIIGRGGESLKKVERYSGARVQIDQDSGDMERTIKLIGEQDQIQLAKDMIQQMVRDASDNGGGGGDDDQDGDIRLKVSVPSNMVGLVIGRGGETIRDLEERSGAKIKVLPESPGGQSSVRTVSITGDNHATEKAKTLVEDIIKDQQQHQGYHNEQRHHDGYGKSEIGGGGGGEKDTVRIPKQFVGLVIGRGGETVRALQEESGARIVVDKYGDPHSDKKTLIIHGTPETIAIAKDLIMEKVESGQNSRGSDRYGSSSGGGYKGGRGDYRSGGGDGGYSRSSGSYKNDYYGKNDDYQQQQQDTSYDYSQYQQYYGQQYGGYDPYNGGYSYGETQQTSSAQPSDDKKEDKESSTTTGMTHDPYYEQYYDQSGQNQQWTQEAYNQYYQQYYGGEGYQPDQQQQYEQQQQEQQQQQEEGYQPEGASTGADDAIEK